MYKSKLQDLGYGPDILHLVKDSALKDIGVPPGDVIRLKTNSLAWWNSPEAIAPKQKRNDETPDEYGITSTPPTKKIMSFEKRFHDGGAARLYGSSLVSGQLSKTANYEWYYFCEPVGDMVPVPKGYVPLLDGTDNENFDPFYDDDM